RGASASSWDTPLARASRSSVSQPDSGPQVPQGRGLEGVNGLPPPWPSRRRARRKPVESRPGGAGAVGEIVSLVVGTAGHIDHGKSSLVRRLTGVDPDRLKEER